MWIIQVYREINKYPMSSDVESDISACAAGRAAISSIQFLNPNSQGVALHGPLLNES